MVASPPAGVRSTADSQQIHFSRSRDGVRIAHARHGHGPPLVVVACWLSHLQYDWQSPVWRHFLEDLGEFTTLIRFDLRGHGLSDWAVRDFSLDALLSDLEAVVEAEHLDRFALMGMSGNSPVALAYAARHPERVTRLILYGGWAGWPQIETDADRDEEAAWVAMIRAGWARPDPTFRRVFTQAFIPDASERQMEWFDALQRMSTSPANAVAARAGRRATNVTSELGSIVAPTLVLHAVGDAMTDFHAGRDAATRISHARLVPLDSRNHILLRDEPAWQVFVNEVREFMAADEGLAAANGLVDAVDDLSRRELEIIRLAAGGLDNAAIASRLVISVRTVERHLSNAYLKLGISGKSARSAAVAALLRRELA
jgi:pimeloyl-ACP methyl ester carboxylesterase/DNA-binding CsgD family transcriptional regulator